MANTISARLAVAALGLALIAPCEGTAEAGEVLLKPGASAGDTTRNRLFVRWARGQDGKWRFSRALLSPKGAAQ